MSVRTVYTTMPTLKSVVGDISYMYPKDFRWEETAVKRQAYVDNRGIIDSGADVDVHVADYGIVEFRFRPTAERRQAGASSGKFIPKNA